EALARYAEVGIGIGRLEQALLSDQAARRGADSAGRRVDAAVPVARHQGRELGAVALVADGVHVGDVLGNDPERAALSTQAGHAGIHRAVEAHTSHSICRSRRAQRVRASVLFNQASVAAGLRTETISVIGIASSFT